ncbi:hypothetical protein [uncultured Alsobacter sp.]|uniref:hypothetical protein n=1 Tax=uncultured Alsobacter sp. TaxID=1748258 RepID=UPI0025D40723|nr:hypothetical protein [uncultured Alsobacter sp.]
MPFVSSQQLSGFWEPGAYGPVVQCYPAAVAPGASIPASSSYDSGILCADGFKAIGAAIKMNQAGTLTITRYLDAAGALPQGAPSSVAITANTQATLNITDNLPFAYFRVQIANSAGSVATIANFAFLMNAA